MNTQCNDWANRLEGILENVRILHRVDNMAIVRFMQEMALQETEEEELMSMLRQLKETEGPEDETAFVRTVHLLSMLLYEKLYRKGGNRYAWALAESNDAMLGGRFVQCPGGNLNEKMFVLAADELSGTKQIFTHCLVNVAEDVEPERDWLSELVDPRTACWQLSEEHKLWCYRDSRGILVLLGIIDYPGSVLADEDYFCEEPPLYFTADSHFQSPVWHLQHYKKIFQALMSIMGYPEMGMTIRLMANNNETEIINEEDMFQDGRWENGEVDFIPKKKLKSPVQGLGIEDYGFPNEWETIIQSARMVFHSKMDRELFSRERMANWLKKKGCLQKMEAPLLF